MAINGIEDEHNHCVAIPWNDKEMSIRGMMHNREVKWHSASIWALEHFGLPGDRYSCRPCKTKMEFWFATEQDAIMFRLRWS